MEQRSGFIAVNVGSLFFSFTTPWINPRMLVGSVLFILFSLTLVPCCDVRYDFYIKTMFGSSLSPVVHILFTVFVRLCFLLLLLFILFLFFFVFVASFSVFSILDCSFGIL